MSRPFHGHSLQKIGNIVSACLIMHDMCISDRVMGGNVYAVYDPCYNVDDDDEEQRMLEEDCREPQCYCRSDRYYCASGTVCCGRR
jgi:hypothetical protein